MFPFDFLSQVQEEQKDKHQKQKVTLIEMRKERGKTSEIKTEMDSQSAEIKGGRRWVDSQMVWNFELVRTGLRIESAIEDLKLAWTGWNHGGSIIRW
jgi:predicted transcriptional regulator with HTH domain